MIGPLTILLVGVLAVFAVATTRSVPARDRDIAWLAGAPVPVDSEAGRVYRRYLERHRGYRLAGAWFGVALATVVGLAWDGQVHAGIGTGSPFGDVLFCGVAGVVVGSLLAETYRLSLPRDAPASASLDARPMLGGQAQVTAGRVMSAAALLVGALTLVSAGATSLAVALAGSVVALAAELTRRAIDDRRRPALSEAAREVDARIRRYAAGAVAHLELSAGALTLGWTVSKAFGDAVAVIGTPLVLAVAVVALHRARPRPPRSFSIADVAALQGQVG